MDLLDYAGSPTLHGQPTEINKVIQDSAASLMNLDGIEIIQELSTGLPNVICDSDRIYRVFANLALNAIEAMPEGGSLTITSKSEGGFVKISFRDTGIGISDGNIERIFEPLFTTKPDGTGFGLAACKEIIDKHGGSIEVTPNDEANKGTNFTVNLPVAA